jgi:hypothetical protein
VTCIGGSSSGGWRAAKCTIPNNSKNSTTNANTAARESA